MEAYLKITNLNDFIFCPLSIYYHELYGSFNPILYHDKSQIDGKAAHEAVDEHRYSTHKNILQGIDVYSSEYGLCGKIDTFNVSTGLLTERKKKIHVIYDGYVFQLYAQCLCLREMGYSVRSLRFWSRDDNKVYPIPLPEDNLSMFDEFKAALKALSDFNPAGFVPESKEKCLHCIYHSFCDRPLEDK